MAASGSPCFSIIVPVYNAELLLRRCVESLLCQTFSDLEILLVDDGSTDGSPALCNALAASDSRVHAIHRPNAGPAAARNRGLREAKGEYLLFVDADDSLEPDACEKLLACARQTQADCVIFGICGAGPEKKTVPEFSRQDAELSILAGDTVSFTRAGYYLDAPWGKLYRTELIRQHGLTFPEQLRRSEDAVFSLYYYEAAEKVVFLPASLYHYEQTDSSIIHSLSDTNVRMLPLVLEANDRFIASCHPDDRTYIAAGNRRIFSGMSEAENRYFLPFSRKTGIIKTYGEYRRLLMQPSVRRHVLDLRPDELISRNQKLKRIFYRTPCFVLFALYLALQRRKF